MGGGEQKARSAVPAPPEVKEVARGDAASTAGATTQKIPEAVALAEVMWQAIEAGHVVLVADHSEGEFQGCMKM